MWRALLWSLNGLQRYRQPMKKNTVSFAQSAWPTSCQWANYYNPLEVDMKHENSTTLQATNPFCCLQENTHSSANFIGSHYCQNFARCWDLKGLFCSLLVIKMTNKHFKNSHKKHECKQSSQMKMIYFGQFCSFKVKQNYQSWFWVR